jgi:hypothetical protein
MPLPRCPPCAVVALGPPSSSRTRVSFHSLSPRYPAHQKNTYPGFAYKKQQNRILDNTQHQGHSTSYRHVSSALHTAHHLTSIDLFLLLPCHLEQIPDLTVQFRRPEGRRYKVRRPPPTLDFADFAILFQTSLTADVSWKI